METKRPSQSPAETTPASRLEAQNHSTRESQETSPKAPKPPSFEGRRHTPETKAKLSELNKGKKLSPETKAKISEAQKGEKNYIYDQSIDKVRLAIIDCVLVDSGVQASRNQGFNDDWSAGWKHNHPQRFDAFYLEAATELDRMVTSGKIGSPALELAAGATREEVAHKLANHLLIDSESSLQLDSQD